MPWSTRLVRQVHGQAWATAASKGWHVASPALPRPALPHLTSRYRSVRMGRTCSPGQRRRHSSRLAACASRERQGSGRGHGTHASAPLGENLGCSNTGGWSLVPQSQLA